MPTDRRTLLKLLGATAGASAFGAAPRALAQDGISLERPAGWDYPAADALLPFGHGVKSGDPLHDRVVIWTRVSIPDPGGWLVAMPQGIGEVDVAWVVARDRALQDVVARGETTTERGADWTVKIDVDGLEPATTYWYAFAALGRTSVVGRTRTAPAPGDAVSEVRVMQTACSKWWAGHFAMYGRMADRDDVDVLLHAGDHIYNQENGNRGNIRLPEAALLLDDPYQHIDCRDWARPEEVGRRYALHAADPDALRAHAAVPFVIMPDQHDTADKDDRGIYGGDGVSNAEAAAYFHLWNADRRLAADGSGRFDAEPRVNLNLAPHRVAGEHARLFYKHLPFGALLDIVTVDMRRSREGNGDAPFLSDAHWAFLERVAADSAARGVAYRVFVNGVAMTQMNAVDLPVIPDSLRERIFRTDALNGILAYGGWNDVPDDRVRLYALLRAQGLVDNIVLTGDIHGQFVAELVEENEAPAYIRGTGLGTYGTPVGVEIMTGMTSGGADEVVAAALYEAAQGRSPGLDLRFQEVNVPAARPVVQLVEAALKLATPNLIHADWVPDAYALVHVTAERATGELWNVDKRDPASGETLSYQFDMPRGVVNIARRRQPEATRGARVAAPFGAATAADPAVFASSEPAPPDAGSGSGGAMGGAALVLAAAAAARGWLSARDDADGNR